MLLWWIQAEVVPAFHKGCADRLTQLQTASARIMALTRKEWPKGTVLARAQLEAARDGHPTRRDSPAAARREHGNAKRPWAGLLTRGYR